MAIKPACDFCLVELTDFGGILLSPPDVKGRVKKYHICPTCYKQLAQKITQK